MLKEIDFLGDSLDRLRDFPGKAKQTAGYELSRVQDGKEPRNYRPMTSIGPGVVEIKIKAGNGEFRVIYVAKLRYCLRASLFSEKNTEDCESGHRSGKATLQGHHLKYAPIKIGGANEGSIIMARFESVWDAISDTPQEVLNMKVRAELMSKLIDTIEAWDITQREAAERLGITQPRVNDLLKGRIDRFSVDTLLNMSAAAHISVALSFVTEVA